MAPMQASLRIRAMTTIVIALMLAACGSTSARPSAEIEGSSWSVESYRGTRPLAGTEMQLSFADGQIRGTAGCNSFGGSYSVEENQIEISELMRTLMACPDPEGLMEQERDFIDTLQAVHRLQLSDHTLVLFTADGGLIQLTSTR